MWVGDHIQEGKMKPRRSVHGVAVAVSQKGGARTIAVYHLLRLKPILQPVPCVHRKLRSPYSGPALDGDDLALSGSAASGFTMVIGPSDRSQRRRRIVWDVGSSRIERSIRRLGHGRRRSPPRYHPPPGIGKEKGKNRIYFYAVKGPRTHKWVCPRQRKWRTVTRIYGQDVDIHELKWVRVVQGPKAVVGDPDDKKSAIPSPTGSDDRVKSAKPKELPGILRNVDYVVYGGNQSCRRPGRTVRRLYLR